MKTKRMWAMSVMVMMATTLAGADIMTVGSDNLSQGYAAWGWGSEIMNQSWTPAPTGTYVQAIGQTFTTPGDSQTKLALTDFKVMLDGAAMGNRPNDTGALYTIRFRLWDSTSRNHLIMEETGTYNSWGWNNHWEADGNSVSNGWLFSGLSPNTQPQLQGNTQYCWEVEVLSATGSNADGLFASCSNSPEYWYPGGNGYYRNSDGSTSPLATWSGDCDTVFLAQFSTVPEPATLTLLSFGLLGYFRRR